MAVEQPLMDVSEARQRMLAHFSPLETVAVRLGSGVGNVLAVAIAAPIALPPFDYSGMDGFAVRAEDTAGACSGSPAILDVIADIPAGFTGRIRIGRGQAARIMTGAPIPEDADTVVPVEATDFPSRNAGSQPPKRVSILEEALPGDNIRFMGMDIEAGDTLLHAGRVLRPQDVGLLSMLGVTDLNVYRKPRVAIFSCGDELLPVEKPLEFGKIHDANTYTLMGLSALCGAEPIDLGIVADRQEDIRDALQRAVDLRADLILSSAGVSVGALDYVRSVIEQEGKLELWRVNMKPGKPMAFGYYQQIPFIGLPGNPVSAFVGFEVFTRPVLMKMAGRGEQLRPKIKARLSEDVQSDGRESYLRAIVTSTEEGYQARLTGHQGSGNLFSLVQANALLLIPSGVKSLPSGAQVDAWLLEEMV